MGEVLYEATRHASRPYYSNYPPRPQQLIEGERGGFLSLISNRGISQLKEKWSEYRHPRRSRKLINLFVSPRGERVAVAAGNQITILLKDDNYQEPFGIFTCSNCVTFTCGLWAEAHDFLAVADDTDTLYFIKANGEELNGLTKRQLKMSCPVVGFISQDDPNVKKSCLCTFSVLTSDGSLHDIEISQEPSASISSSRTSIFSGFSSKNGSTLKNQFPQNVLCLDYHPRSSLLAVVSSTASILLPSDGSTGYCSVSLWRRTRNLDLELVVSTQFEGLYSKPKGYTNHLSSPKLLISPLGKFVAALDLRGCLVIFKLDEEQCSLSKFSCGESYNSLDIGNKSSKGWQPLNDVVDFTWWSDHILTVVKMSGTVTMLDILSGTKLLENEPVYSMPILERAHQLPGHLFLLESSSSKDELPGKKAASALHLEQVTTKNYNQIDFAKLCWSLVSFSEKSILEMYDILISAERYRDALDFANHHGLDKDQVLKSQWLHSCQGRDEINVLLSTMKDQVFVLSECVERVGPTEDAVRALLAYGLHLTSQYRFSASENDECSQIWEFRLARLKLLQFRDRLETFLGINMGRFSVQEYSKFRIMPINECAAELAASGKIGALNLLFKRHTYSLTPYMLEVMAAIPETVPVQTYGQLLPGNSPPSSIFLREEDWVECEKMIAFINRVHPNEGKSIIIRTEPIVKQCIGFAWPSANELSIWYKNRARDIDTLSGQLDNCLCLVDFACRQGICEMQQFRDDISYLHQLIYSEGTDEGLNFSMGLIAWEQLSDYEKFKMMLKSVQEENVIKILHDKAIPFMQNTCHDIDTLAGDDLVDNHPSVDETRGSYLVNWLKELASANKLDICLIVIEEGCREFQSTGFFSHEAEAVDCTLQCIYLCSALDRWSTMASILSKLPQLRDSDLEGLKRRLKLAEGHIEAGRLLAFYQVPKPISFFLEIHSDGKGVKQILRLILSKFIRRQPARSDNEWANMWRDLHSLQEKAFPFVDLEYMLIEFCRGLLKAGKFSLARSYLKGTGSIALATDKAENLVIQAAREYFFSASSLACSEIWKAKECLNIFPSSRIVRAEADIIDAVTVRLPNIGVNLLPVQFRQIKDLMEIIKLAITSHGGAYLNVDELIEIAKLLGMNSQDDIAAIQEAVAREAAVAGDLQLAFDLCLALAKKGHGSIWDLCAALARGPILENMDIGSQKQLLGFALSHCDDESIGELLHAWKDLDIQGQCETLVTMSRKDPPDVSVHGSSIISYPLRSTPDTAGLRDSGGPVNSFGIDDQEAHLKNVKNVLSVVAKYMSVENGSNWESTLRDNGKIFSFAALQLPWLLELSQGAESGMKFIPGSIPAKQYSSIRTRAIVTIISWLARNGFSPKDDLIASLAKSIMESPVSEEEDIVGCSFLLNLTDEFHGVEIIEEQARTREEYNEICSIMNVGMMYGLLHNSGVNCEGPAQRRELLLRKFQEKHMSITSDERDRMDKTQSSFWREWKLKLEEQKRLADHSRVLEKIFPGVETAHFLSGDMSYMESVVFSLVATIRLERKKILNDVLKVAHTYGLDHTKVLLQYIGLILISEVWATEDIMAELSESKSEILSCPVDVIRTISSSVYPAIDGHDKQRLACIYSLLYDCSLQLDETKESLPVIGPDAEHVSTIGLTDFFKTIEVECSRVSFIKNLNFKNIAGLRGLNFECFNSEVCAHIDECSVEALATVVRNLVGIHGDPVPEGLISWRYVYRHHVLSLLTSLETKAITEAHFRSPKDLRCFINELEQTYDTCKKYIKDFEYPGSVDIMKQFFSVIVPHNYSINCDFAWQDCLIVLLNFWLRLTDDMQEFASHESSEENLYPKCLMACLNAFVILVVERKLSPSQGWGTVIIYVKYGLLGNVSIEISNFCRAMIFSGCGFEAILAVISEVRSQFPLGSTSTSDSQRYPESIQDLPSIHVSILDTILEDLASGSLDHQNLHRFVSSLSKLEGDLDELKRVRQAVWARMAKFSDNLQLPSYVRVYVLELMQFITATSRNLKGFSAELQDNVLPWSGWDNLQIITTSIETSANDHGGPKTNDASAKFANTLVALKSSQLVWTISQSIEITPDVLLTLESAISCFLKVSEAAISESHVDALVAILGEWEGLFTPRKDEPESAEASDIGNNWGGDDWDEGWESFQEEPVEEETKRENTLSVHPLHVCWMEIFKKLVVQSRCRDMLKLIDQSLERTSGMLFDEEGAHSMSQTLIDVDCLLALKMTLLLPYEAIQLLCLDAVEDKLKLDGISDAIGRDHELLLLVLSSGIVSTIITKSSYRTTFSYICYTVGNLSRLCQESQFLSLRHTGSGDNETKEKKFLILFRRIIFPCFLAELVKADQQILAGFVITKYLHMSASLSFINVAEASLRRYLQSQLQVLQSEGFTREDMDFCETLVNTVSSLRSRLGGLISSALSVLPTSVR